MTTLKHGNDCSLAAYQLELALLAWPTRCGNTFLSSFRDTDISCSSSTSCALQCVQIAMLLV